MDKEKQIERIYTLITELAAGNLDYRSQLSGSDNELDAITIGINMLAEELKSTTVSKNFLSRIYHGVVDMLFVLSPEGIIQEVNPRVLSTLGYDDKNLVGIPITELFSKKDDRSFAKMTSELRRKGYVYDIERAFKTKRGRSIPVSISASLLYDDKKHVNGIMYISKDITKIKKTEEQLRGKNEELNTFIYRASHDLKGPLSSIIGLLNLSKGEADDIDELRQYLNLIEQSSKRLDNVLNNFLELGRLTHTSVKYAKVDMDSMLKEIIGSMEFSPDMKGVQISINNSYDRPFSTKKVIMTAILQNLIDNSLKYRSHNRRVPEVKINVHGDDEELVIEVADNGLGIDKNIQSRIFDMFFRGNTQIGGSGLGLYIVKSGVETLKGRIDFKSKPGQGTTFSIHLPVRK